jgi:hypothetical protein
MATERLRDVEIEPPGHSSLVPGILGEGDVDRDDEAGHPRGHVFGRATARAAAYASGLLFLLGVVTLFAFFAFGQPWGSINDAIAALMGISLMLLVPFLYRLSRAGEPTFARAAAAIGLAGMAVFVVSSILVILKATGVMTFPEIAPGTGPYGATIWAGAAIGLWLVAVNLLGRHAGLLTTLHRRLGILAGLGYLLGTVGFATGGLDSPLSALAGLMLFVGFPYWSIRLGRRLGG